MERRMEMGFSVVECRGAKKRIHHSHGLYCDLGNAPRIINPPSLLTTPGRGLSHSLAPPSFRMSSSIKYLLPPLALHSSALWNMEGFGGFQWKIAPLGQEHPLRKMLFQSTMLENPRVRAEICMKSVVRPI